MREHSTTRKTKPRRKLVSRRGGREFSVRHYKIQPRWILDSDWFGLEKEVPWKRKSRQDVTCFEPIQPAPREELKGIKRFGGGGGGGEGVLVESEGKGEKCSSRV
jgi:hypothetical protein